MNRRSFLKVFGLGGITAAVAAPSVLAKFDPGIPPVDDTRIAMPRDIRIGQNFRQFQYHLGHDKYGRIFMHNLLNGQWIRYNTTKRYWCESVHPDLLPPPS